MTERRILILEHDSELLFLISEQIQSQDFEVKSVSSYHDAFQFLAANETHVLLFDFKIPEIKNADLVIRIRNLYPASRLGLLMLVGEYPDEEKEKMKSLGVDDFLVMPFDRSTLLAKVKQLAVKIKPLEGSLPPQSGKRVLGEITLDVKSFDVYCSGERVHLTPNEFKLLQVLMENPKVVLSRDQLIDLVQGAGIAVIDRAIDTHIFSLRKKLGPSGEQIETVRGSGYCIKESR